ncbi:uncharacterized protein LOC128731540 [Anopheles nili]|uniref:uncharacterized protein LOC128731540 n=1 Tax=Anopheles nili TaxID=185578 RepID=UPI00237BE8E2|nr:uncharacterized protein LOC128731540 [Anopheles nili]
MKHQQVVPDYVAMVKTSGTCLCLVFSGWVLFKLVQAIFWLPGYLEKTQGNLYRRLELRATDVCDEAVKSSQDQNATSSKCTRERSSQEDLNANEDDALISEEKMENEAIEPETDSKKDK